MVAVIDVFMAAYEADAINVRLAELEGVVDAHHAVQGTLTFRGAIHQPLTLPQKVISTIVEIPDQFVFEDGAEVDPLWNLPWCREKFLRDASLTEALHLDPEAFFLVCDGDEIPHPDAIRQVVREYGSKGPRRLVTDGRQWYANWRVPDAWQQAHQPVMGRYRDFLQVADGWAGATAARRWGWPPCDATGWHLSNLGDTAFTHRKLGMFAHAERDNPHDRNLTRLRQYRRARRDHLDRYTLEITADLPATIHQFPHLVSR